MRDTAQIKKHNTDMVRTALRSLSAATKQQVAQVTGLSVSTSNTILNELESSGEALCQKMQTGDVGRSAKTYSLNKNFSAVICLHFKIASNQKILYYNVLNLLGEIITEKTEVMEHIFYEDIEERIRELLEKHSNVSRISIGVPGITEQNRIRHCDIDELIDYPLGEKLEHTFSIPVILETDMHAMVYGYYKKVCDEKSIVSIAIFVENILPGSGTVVEGNVIRGATRLAGQIGFLPYGMTQEEQKKKQTRKDFLPLACKSITSLIAIMNPHIIIVTGDLADDSLPQALYASCQTDISKEHLPEIIYIKNIDHYYIEGLYSLAIEYGKDLLP